MRVNVEGYDIVKDLNTGAILNTDSAKLNAYKAMKIMKRNENDRITKIENDIVEIKEMLKIIIESNVNKR